MLRLAVWLSALLGSSPPLSGTAAVAQDPAESDVSIHVAPDGHDSWSGDVETPDPETGEGPLATLEAARDRVRALLASGHAGDVTVRIGAGRYELGAPLVLGPADGAVREGQLVTWAAASTGEVLLSGGRRLGAWDREDDGSWSHAFSGTRLRQLFVENERRPRARLPDAGWLRVVEPGADGRTSFRFEPGELQAWSDLALGELVFLHDWSISRVGMRSVDETEHSVRLEHPIGARLPFLHITGFEAHPRYRIENLRAAWDRPGEWYADPAGSRLRYRPLPDEVALDTEAVIPVLSQLLVIRGAPETPVRGLYFDGLTFSHTRAADPPRGFAGVQASFHELRPESGEPSEDVAPPAAVTMTDAVDCTLERCRFEHLGGTGLSIGEGSRRGRVQSSVFTGIGANGVMIGSSNEPREEDAHAIVARILFADNLVERCGEIDFGAVGVWIGFAEGVRVEHNVVRDLPYSGVSLGWLWDPRPTASRGHRITHNHIHHVMQLLSDGGGVYTLGRQPDTIIGSNLIHDVPINLGRAESNGIFVDEGSNELVIEGNVIHSLARSPVRFHRAGRNFLRSNVLVAPAGVPSFAYHDCTADDKVFVGNSTPDPGTWSPPSAAELGAGIRTGR